MFWSLYNIHINSHQAKLIAAIVSEFFITDIYFLSFLLFNQHVQVLIHEIEDYRHNLDQVNRKGQQLIAANRSVPQLAHQIQSQIQNLEESYSNLELTARQIRVSNF